MSHLYSIVCRILELSIASGINHPCNAAPDRFFMRLIMKFKHSVGWKSFIWIANVQTFLIRKKSLHPRFSCTSKLFQRKIPIALLCLFIQRGWYYMQFFLKVHRIRKRCRNVPSSYAFPTTHCLWGVRRRRNVLCFGIYTSLQSTAKSSH